MNDEKVQEPVLKLPPITVLDYCEMRHGEFMDLVSQASELNQGWMRRNFPPGIDWAVVVDGKIVHSGDHPPFPNEIRIRQFGMRGYAPYLLMKSVPRRDLRFFFRGEFQSDICQLLGMSHDEVESYSEPEEGIVTLATTSGSLNKLLEKYALGSLAVLQPKIDEKRRHAIGATTVKVYNHQFGGKYLYIAAQIADHVHQRGGKTAEEREPDRWYRVERRHRFDDPIADILDTYDMVKQQDWPPLVLYRSRDKYPTVKARR